MQQFNYSNMSEYVVFMVIKDLQKSYIRSDQVTLPKVMGVTELVDDIYFVCVNKLLPEYTHYSYCVL